MALNDEFDLNWTTSMSTFLHTCVLKEEILLIQFKASIKQFIVLGIRSMCSCIASRMPFRKVSMAGLPPSEFLVTKAEVDTGVLVPPPLVLGHDDMEGNLNTAISWGAQRRECHAERGCSSTKGIESMCKVTWSHCTKYGQTHMGLL